MDATRLTLTPAAIDAAIDAGHPYAPILALMRAGRCFMMSVFQTAPGDALPAFELPDRNGKGLVISIGDDLDQSFGPAGFDPASLDRMLRDCDCVILQVANFRPDVMSVIAATAATGRTVAIIETRERHEIEWLDLIKSKPGKPVLVVTTKPETTH